MPTLEEEIYYRSTLLQHLAYRDAQPRLVGIYEWLRSEPEILPIVERLETEAAAKNLLPKDGPHSSIRASTPDEIAGVGLLLLQEIRDGEEPYKLCHKYGIRPSYSTTKIQDLFDALLDGYVGPAIEFVRREMEIASEIAAPATPNFTAQHPLEITESLRAFRKDHPDPRRTAFVMMQFGVTAMHESIIRSIRSTLAQYGVAALRADDKEYHDDLFPNVLTYMHGSAFGIAVFERLEAEDFNPNVSLEVGYMRAIRKPVCLLKDKTLRTLQTDLVGRLYKQFDPQNPSGTIPAELEKWLADKEITT